jgi:translocation and assembly module TamA
MFMEAGKVSYSQIPLFNREETLAGGGIGGRYYSSIGPIRVDIAFPFKRRRARIGHKKIDSPIQFYISIGQAF